MGNTTLRLTVLGSGTSMGVPTVGCPCPVCHSGNPRDNRTRASVLFSLGEQNVVIDTSPDFRTQALRVGLTRLDAVVLTHAHADHILGFDDIRPFNMRQNRAMPVYGSEETLATLKRTFAYVFDDAPVLSAIPQVTLHSIQGPFHPFPGEHNPRIEFMPIPAEHGPMSVLGFRVGRMAYLTDVSGLPEQSRQFLTDLDDLVLDALRDTPHPMHMTVEQALSLVAQLRPRRTWFTHIAHELPHEATNARLRSQGLPNVALAYDGLSFEVRI